MRPPDFFPETVAVLGYAFFAEVPGVFTWAGAVMIFAAVFFIAYRESRAREGRPRASTA